MINLGTRGHRQRSAWLLLIIVILVGGLASALVMHWSSHNEPKAKVLGEKVTQSPTNANGNGNGNGNGGSNPGHPITVTGTSPTGLAPGVTRPVVVTVTNPNNQAIRVTTVTISVGNASGSCPSAGNITTSSYSSSLPGATAYVAPKNGQVHVPLTITMLDTPVNQDVCKDVTFPLTFAATGQQA